MRGYYQKVLNKAPEWGIAPFWGLVISPRSTLSLEDVPGSKCFGGNIISVESPGCFGWRGRPPEIVHHPNLSESINQPLQAP